MGRTYRKRHVHTTEKSQMICSLSNDSANISLMRTLKLGGWSNETSLKIGSFKNTGRGVFSTTPIKTTDPLIELPYANLITMATIENDSDFKLLFAEAFTKPHQKFSIQCLLGLYLLFRKHNNEPYCSTIPDGFTNPYFCTKQELMILPETVFDRILQQSEEITKSYTAFAAVFASQTCPCCQTTYFPELFDQSSYKWAYFAVNSRSVFIDPAAVKRTLRSQDFKEILKDQPNTALAPFLDLLNHSDSIEVSKPEFFVPLGTLKSNTLTYKLFTKTAFRPYEQIFISYGPFDNMKLLLEYGFILAHNQHDCVRLDMKDIAGYLEATARQQKKQINSNKFKFIKENNLSEEMFVNRADGLSHNLLVVLTILFVDTLAPFSNILSQVGFGDVPALEPIANVAKQILEFKANQLRLVEQKLHSIGEGRSKSGEVCLSYVHECICLINDVVHAFL